MNRVAFIFFIFSWVVQLGLQGQVYETISKPHSFDIHKVFIPPKLIIPDQDIVFDDENGNNRLDAGEVVEVSFIVRNEGEGVARGLSLDVKNVSLVKGFEVIVSDNDFTIEPSQQRRVSFKLIADNRLETGMIELYFKVMEPHGINSNLFEYGFKSLEFLKPQLVIIDPVFTSTSGKLKRKEPLSLVFIIQNKGQGDAENTQVSIEHDKRILSLSGNKSNRFDSFKPGEHEMIKYDFIIPEAEGTFGQENTHSFTLVFNDTRLNEREEFKVSLEINSESDQTISAYLDSDDFRKKEIKSVGLISDVDKNIPINKQKDENKFALIIGNENYSSGFNSETNVPFAINDAKSMQKYLVNTLGFKEENCFLLTDATRSQIVRDIRRVIKLCEIREDAKVFFYYAGHGEPLQETDEPYIVPVDASVDLLKEQGLALKELHSLLAESNANQITVFLDACFSGGGRENGLLPARSIRINAKNVDEKKNMIILSSSQGNQKSLPYSDKNHGVFTYYLLKKIQETSGRIAYKELYDYVNRMVSEQAIRMNYEQTPKLQYGRLIDVSKTELID